MAGLRNPKAKLEVSVNSEELKAAVDSINQLILDLSSAITAFEATTKQASEAALSLRKATDAAALERKKIVTPKSNKW